MQALTLFVIFGMFMATVAGILATGSETSRQLTLNRAAESRRFFNEAENILRNRITFQEMDIAQTSQCDGLDVETPVGSGITPVNGRYDPRPYLCRMEVRQLASWDMGTNNVTDPWRNPITGVVVRRMQAVAPGVEAPVTAFAIISPGPDKVVSANLLARLNTVRLAASTGTATFRDVLTLSSDLDRAAGVFTDDIVHTFSNLTTQLERWERISSNLDQIMAGMQESYTRQYATFLPVLRSYYDTLPPGSFNTLYGWKAAAIPLDAFPSMAIPDLNNLTSDTDGRAALGKDEIFAELTNPIPNGSSMAVRQEAFSSVAVPGAADLDSMRLILTSNGSPWVVHGTGFTRTITMAP